MLEIIRSPFPIAELAQSSLHIPLIRSSILPLLHSPSDKWIAVEAHLENKLVGLTLSEIYDEGLNNISAQLYSFIVLPSYRQQGIGRQLFSFTQKLLVEEERINSFEFLYTQEDPFTQAIEKILASQGWTPAKTSLIRCYFDMWVFNPPWLHYPNRLSSSMKFFSWKNLLSEDRKHIQYLADQGRFPLYLNPLQQEELINIETSVGLRQKDKVVGWSVTQHFDPLTLFYSSLYIDKELLHIGYGIQLLAESIRRHKNLPIRYAYFEVNIKGIDRSWAYFIKKRLIPLAFKIEHIKHPVKLFLR